MLMSILAVLSLIYCTAQQNNWSDVEHIFGKKGNVTGNVLKVGFPRSDLKIKVGGFSVEPAFALGSWVGMMKMHDKTVMMGDLVLLDSEVPKAIKKLTEENLDITAIHNHLINESPNIKYLHYFGEGDASTLARKIKAVLSVTGTPLTAPPTAKPTKNVDWSEVTAVLGPSGKPKGVLLQYGFPRNEKITEDGMEMPPAMGVGTGINFQKNGKQAAITGDFVLKADEVNPVIRAITENGITVTALHNHMLHDEPRLFMMHFWAVGEPGKLAKGLKAALDKTNIKH